jgi:glycine/D-amino acid oxidase-like deaminating enzyme
MQTTNFWATLLPPQKRSSQSQPAEIDVAIIGGGLTGLNAALELAKNGISCAVFEQETIGWGASSRNGGMMTPGLKASLRSITRAYGLERAREFWQWSLDAIDYVQQIIVEEEIDCDFERNGYAWLACKPKHMENVRREKQWLKENFDYSGGKIIPREELRTEIGTDDYDGAFVDDFGAGLNPAQYTHGLAEAAARSGVCLLEKTPVTKIMRETGQFRVTTPNASTRARQVLLATNGYTTHIVPKARSGIFPVGSYIIVTEPLSEDLQREISPRKRMFYDSKKFIKYFRLTADGRLLYGGRNNLSTTLDLHKSAENLRADMLATFPQLKHTVITHTWTGKLGITFDLLPHVGRFDGIHYAYGYSGHGLSIASYLGREVGQLLAGKIPSTIFAEINHPRTILANFDKLYLPFVAAWYRFLDRVN